MEIVQTFPPEYANRVKSTYEQVLDEGMEKGIEKGMEKGRKEGRKEGIEEGMETLVRNIITNRPDYSDQYVADLLNVPISLVARVRASQ